MECRECTKGVGWPGEGVRLVVLTLAKTSTRILRDRHGRYGEHSAIATTSCVPGFATSNPLTKCHIMLSYLVPA